jgi:predicted MFS family arabinose efflux permease
LGPHMVFLVDFVARGLGRGLDDGALTWVLFGAGALCGPIIVGQIVDRLGPERASRLVIAAEAVAVALLLLPSSMASLGASALLGGLVASGITTAMLGRIGMRAGADHAIRQRGWTQATIAWAMGQAAGTYGMAWLYNRTGDYRVLFVASLAALAAAAIVEVVISFAEARRTA